MYHAKDKKTSRYLVPAVQICCLSVRISVSGTVQMYCGSIGILLSGTVKVYCILKYNYLSNWNRTNILYK